MKEKQGALRGVYQLCMVTLDKKEADGAWNSEIPNVICCIK